MTVLIISIVAAWIIFSALLVTIICINSSRFNRKQDPLERYKRKIEEWAEAYDKDAIHMTQEEFDEIYNDAYFEAVELE